MPQLIFEDFAPQLIWLGITFLSLYLVMARIALPRIANVIEERRDRIATDLDEAEQLKEKTEAAIAEYEQALAEANAKALAIAQETRAALAEEIDSERARVEQEMVRYTDQAEVRIKVAKQDAIAEINDVAADTAQLIVKTLVGGEVTKREVRGAIRKAIGSQEAARD